MKKVFWCCWLWWLPLVAVSQPVAVIRLPALEKLLNQPSDTTYILNFWATWCGPCIKELPYFEELNAIYAGKKIRVILISTDFASKLEEKVKPFVQKRSLKSTVLLLNEPDQNAWIDRVDKNWSGAIPFTLMINNGKKRRKAFEKEFTRAELETEVNAFLR
ncbi:MAG: TlpA family protein disulfide reductase [Ferruginibacter sp.]|nr:TlpA family protein disulfide reductase [Cytophagales bacterium]